MQITTEQLDLIIYTIEQELLRYDNSRGTLVPLFYIEISVADLLLEALKELKIRRQHGNMS